MISISPSPSISAAKTEVATSSPLFTLEAVKETVPLNIVSLLTTPVIEIVGVAVIPSLKVAVMVTVSEAAKKLSSSVSLRVTVGAVASNVIFILSDPA